jgi:regulatory protein
MMSERKYSLLEAKVKIESWCAYRERAFSEVHAKLKTFGLDNEDTDRLIAELIRSNFLNEERFARAYCSGKFRIKGWGRIKIRQHLKSKHVTDKCIQLGMQEIDPDEYYSYLIKLTHRKWSDLSKEKNHWNRKAKLIRFLQQKGYEQDFIYEAIGEVLGGE